MVGLEQLPAPAPARRRARVRRLCGGPRARPGTARGHRRGHGGHLRAPDRPDTARRDALVQHPRKRRPRVRESGSGTRETIDEALAAQGLKVTPALTLASNAALNSSATVGIGPAVLSELSLVEELKTGHLVKVEVEGLDLRRPLSVVWRGAGALPPAAAVLIDIVAEDAAG